MTETEEDLKAAREWLAEQAFYDKLGGYRFHVKSSIAVAGLLARFRAQGREAAQQEAQRCDGCGRLPGEGDDGSCGCGGRGVWGMLTHARECLVLAQTALEAAEARLREVEHGAAFWQEQFGMAEAHWKFAATVSSHGPKCELCALLASTEPKRGA